MNQLSPAGGFDPRRVNYTSGRGILRVVMEDKARQQVLSPLDLAVLQTVLTDGKFPPLYSNLDIYDCTKASLCICCIKKVMYFISFFFQRKQSHQARNKINKNFFLLFFTLLFICLHLEMCSLIPSILKKIYI